MGKDGSEDGSLVLEAALALPFFLVFLLAMNCFLRLAVVESKLQAAASESVKQIATHFGPVDLLYQEASKRLASTKTGILIGDVLGRIENARAQAMEVEDAVLEREALIPQSIVDLLRWEKSRREQLETAGKEAVADCIDPLLNRAFAPIVLSFAETRVIRKDNLRVTKVTMPDLYKRRQLDFGIELAYDYKLPLPFINRTVTLKKKAMERVWVGSAD